MCKFAQLYACHELFLKYNYLRKQLVIHQWLPQNNQMTKTDHSEIYPMTTWPERIIDCLLRKKESIYKNPLIKKVVLDNHVHIVLQHIDVKKWQVERGRQSDTHCRINNSIRYDYFHIRSIMWYTILHITDKLLT